MQIFSISNSTLDPKTGTGKSVTNFCQGLRDQGHQVEVYEPKDYTFWPSFRRANKFRATYGAWQLMNRLMPAVLQSDIVEFYGDEFWLTIRQLSRLKQRPLLVAHTNGLELLDLERGQIYDPPKNLVRKLFVSQTHARFSRITFANTDAFVALGAVDRQYVLDQGLYAPEWTQVTAIGLDPEYLQRPFVAEREHRVAYTGSWIPRKNIKNLATVMTRVLRQRPTLKLDLFGTRSEPAAILGYFEPDVHGQITVYGSLSNRQIADHLTQAKVFFFPSQYEGFGIALAEAMACGCAAISTPTGYGAELSNGKEIIIHDFDDTVGMEQSILKLLDQDAWRLAIAKAGWDRVQSLTWAACTQKLGATYTDWVDRHRQRLHP